VAGGIRVLIVDDHPIFRDGMSSLLESVAGFDVVG
jgi:DNA-binding NarL/FixJ family response regulator